MSEPSQNGLSPMMEQYQRIKSQIPPDALLLFKLGDFYELLFDDAKDAAKLLNITLCSLRGVPMCGIPYHAKTAWVAILVKAGRRVAICDLLEKAQPGRLAERGVVESYY